MNLGIKIIIVSFIVLTISIIVSLLTIEHNTFEPINPNDLPTMTPIKPEVFKFNPLSVYSAYASFITMIVGIVIWRKRK